MNITDFHTHILPEIDDGSQSIKESIQLVKSLSEQGVKKIVATPHFHTESGHLNLYLKKRNEAYTRLLPRLPQNSPKIVLGAEIEYYEDICYDADDLKALSIEGTNLLLLEMPNCKWGENTIDELVDMASSEELKIVLAHIERYVSKQSTKQLKRLIDSGILMQANATFFTSVFTRRRALSMLKHGMIHLIGSDCHGINRRPPYIKKAYEVIEKKLGTEHVAKLLSFSDSLFDDNKE